MKKILTLLMATIAAFLVVGCSNSSSSSSNKGNDYKTEMSKGNKAVDNKEYSKALTHYKSANEAKSTTKSSAYKKQAQNLVSANKQMNKREFSDAKTSLNKAKNQNNGNAKMTKRAKTLLKQVKEIIQNRADFKINIKTDKSLIKSDNIDQATTLLKQITGFKGIKGKYYSDIYKQAKKLLDNMPKSSAKATSASTDTTNNSSNNSDSTATNGDSSTDTSDSDNPAANGDFDKESRKYDGGTITDADIAKARQQLTDSGVKDVPAWSDSEIIRAIKNAHAAGRTTVQESDGKVSN
ncbi:outer membrane protein assembly factor BamD [Companilactobacillus kedongensis]|uniref:hypothetical protein n=1 Tax=Companilactobacillus kedongensis TaxID=2486004 RepID=UPI000F77D63E|nr:hypothetical protein [Companilactobacillus kedongensis]